MHNHNEKSSEKNESHKGMMWMMVICCLLPVVILLGGTTFFKSIGYNWIGVGLIVIFLVIHLSKMWRAKHGHVSDNQNIENQKDKGGHNNCCH